VRRRLPPAPPELPARLRSFDPVGWAEPDDPDDGGWSARRRWGAARVEWCLARGADPLAMLRQGINDRRRGDGLPPIDYGGWASGR